MEATVKIRIRINEYELKLLHELEEKAGYTQDEVFRMALRMIHKKELPAYKMKIIKREMSPEDGCIADGGEVVMRDGVTCCYIKNGALEQYIPLM